MRSIQLFEIVKDSHPLDHCFTCSHQPGKQTYTSNQGSGSYVARSGTRKAAPKFKFKKVQSQDQWPQQENFYTAVSKPSPKKGVLPENLPFMANSFFNTSFFHMCDFLSLKIVSFAGRTEYFMRILQQKPQTHSVSAVSFHCPPF